MSNVSPKLWVLLKSDYSAIVNKPTQVPTKDWPIRTKPLLAGQRPCTPAQPLKMDRTANPEGWIYPISSITWPIVEDTLRPVYVKYQQDLKPIPADKFDLLIEWLSTIYKCFGAQLTGSSSNNEAKRVHLIAPIIWVIASLLDGVTVDIERTIRGRRIKANGTFEFILERQNKRICIVEAKKQDLDQGLAHDLVRCEVIADLDGIHEVYGIVTTFDRWIFLKSLDGKILFDESNILSFDGNGVPVRYMLENVVGKLYNLLL